MFSNESWSLYLVELIFAVLLQIMNGERNCMPYAPTYSALQVLRTHALGNNSVFSFSEAKYMWMAKLCLLGVLFWAPLNPFISSVVADVLWTWSDQRFIVLLSPVAQCQGRMHVENWFSSIPLCDLVLSKWCAMTIKLGWPALEGLFQTETSDELWPMGQFFLSHLWEKR